MRHQRGQALVIAALALGIVAMVIGGLRLAQDRVLGRAVERRAGEAAVEAATAVVADAYLAEVRRVAASAALPAPTPDVVGAVTSAGAREAARAAATAMSVTNGGREVDEVTVRCANAIVQVSLFTSGTSYRAGFPVAACSPR